ncbi:retinol dehydrogenase 12-like isoform X1 [Amphibalanus amphitrite]|uniref:retinol dehydrogenase 12-like isoform X1 n=2 Tax=Amphibalanus amphitrite TaxID=1232801 RepID=UPI001C92969E|nr:retinol dehydrogenase 12-like isoform X1 [Amphibalanus amphitrite]
MSSVYTKHEFLDVGLMEYLPLFGSLVGIAVFGAYFYRRARVAGTACDCADRIDGRVVLITGANSGIGLQVARELALRGGRVYLACRSLEEARHTAFSIINETSNTSVRPLQLDLNSLASVRRLVSELRQAETRLDILVNNAGCFYCPPSLTEDGFTVTFQTNYLGHFLLTRLLAPLLVQAAAGARVVFVSSAAHLTVSRLEFDCAGRAAQPAGAPPLAPAGVPAEPPARLQYHVAAYGQAKLALAVFAAELARRLRGKDICVNSVDPGNVNTDIYRHYRELNTFHVRLLRCFLMRTPSEGAQTVIHCACSSKIDGVTGQYFKDCTIADANPLVRDREVGEELWRLSDRWTGLSSL